MAFDPCPHQITQIILKAGAIIRELKGLPEEKNITILYNETAPLLGVVPVQMDSRIANHLPSPAEMKDEKGKLLLPAKDCPKCGAKESVFPMSVCGTCEDWANGFRSSWTCMKCGHKDLLTTPYPKLLDELRVKWESGFKEEMGIHTVTNEGIK